MSREREECFEAPCYGKQMDLASLLLQPINDSTQASSEADVELDFNQILSKKQWSLEQESRKESKERHHDIQETEIG